MGNEQMKILLDTHVWIWSQEAIEKIGPHTLSVLKDPKNTIYISPISTLEIARLIELQQILLSGTLLRWVSSSINNLLGRTIPISHEIAIKAYSLPPQFHKDPADRMLVASALIEDLTILSADEKILDYPHVKSYNAVK
jgi:PIN domain nuclease of toxin-antitoxin system